MEATIRDAETSWMCLILRPPRPIMVPMRLCEMRRRIEVCALAAGVTGLASGGELTGLARRVCAINPYAWRISHWIYSEKFSYLADALQ